MTVCLEIADHPFSYAPCGACPVAGPPNPGLVALGYFPVPLRGSKVNDAASPAKGHSMMNRPISPGTRHRASNQSPTWAARDDQPLVRAESEPRRGEG